jgi:hypothetical protein
MPALFGVEKSVITKHKPVIAGLTRNPLNVVRHSCESRNPLNYPIKAA